MVVPSDPRAKGRPRSTRGGGVYTPERTRAAEREVRFEAVQAMRSQRLTVVPVAALHVDLAYYAKTARRVDLDNLVKLTLDALNGVVWADDAQIVGLSASKRLDRVRPRTEVRVSVVRAVGGAAGAENAA